MYSKEDCDFPTITQIHGNEVGMEGCAVFRISVNITLKIKLKTSLFKFDSFSKTIKTIVSEISFRQFGNRPETLGETYSFVLSYSYYLRNHHL